MAKSDPMKSPLKGSSLPPEILEKLARQSISNPDAPFGSKPEQMTLVRHLMWQCVKARRKTTFVEVSSRFRALRKF